MKMMELEKMEKIREKSQIIGEFLDWLQNERKICLAKYFTEEVPTQAKGSTKTFQRINFAPLFIHSEKLLAEFFHINLKKAEMEKRTLLKQIRSTQKKGGA